MRRFNPKYLYIEEAANGVACIQMLNKARVRGVVGVQPEGGKYSRAMAVTWLFAQGHCYFDKEADYYKEYEKSLCVFPKGTHDDDVDATSQALNRMSMLAAHESVADLVVGKKCVWDEDMIEDYMNAGTIERRAMIEAWGDPTVMTDYSNGASLNLMGA
jgi:hypothetical protein